jgi:hypothetical protein
MTAKKDLKRRVRDRQARTGESYVTARRRVVEGAQETPRATIPVVEMIDLTADAERLGLKCRVIMPASLATQLDPVATLTRVRDALIATADDPDTAPLRGVALRGERLGLPPRMPPGWIERLRRFVARAKAGIGGVSDGGNLLALAVDGHAGAVMVVVHAGFRPASAQLPGPPRLMISSIDVLTANPLPTDELTMMFVP